MNLSIHFFIFNRKGNRESIEFTPNLFNTIVRFYPLVPFNNFFIQVDCFIVPQFELVTQTRKQTMPVRSRSNANEPSMIPLSRIEYSNTRAKEQLESTSKEKLNFINYQNLNTKTKI